MPNSVRVNLATLVVFVSFLSPALCLAGAIASSTGKADVSFSTNQYVRGTALGHTEGYVLAGSTIGSTFPFPGPLAFTFSALSGPVPIPPPTLNPAPILIPPPRPPIPPSAAPIPGVIVLPTFLTLLPGVFYDPALVGSFLAQNSYQGYLRRRTFHYFQ